MPAVISRDTVRFFDRMNTHDVRVVAYTGNTSYVTGGDSLTPELVALGRIDAVIGAIISNGSAVLWGFWNPTTKKILWYSATSTEATNGTDYSGYTGRFVVLGS